MIVCFEYVRTVALDNTVNFGEHRLQLLPGEPRRSYARAEVEVHERLDGSVAVCYAGRCLLVTSVPIEAPELRARHGRRALGRAGSHIQSSPSSMEPSNQAPQGESEEGDVSTRERPGSVPKPDHPWRKPLLKPKQAPVSPHVS